MNRIMKRIATLALAFALTAAAVSAPVGASASAPAANLPAITSVCETAYETAMFLGPRFTHFSRISSGLSFNDLGRAACTGSYTIYIDYNYDSTMTMTLQWFNESDAAWTDVKVWTGDFTKTGTKMLDKGYYVSERGKYRVVTVAKIFDDDGTLLETIACDSPTKEY